MLTGALVSSESRTIRLIRACDDGLFTYLEFAENANLPAFFAVDPDGNTVVHNAAARGDTEMIRYLVSKGADVKKVNRAGQTTIDVANGPVQRTQPYPETIKLLEKLGAKNNHRCITC